MSSSSPGRGRAAAEARRGVRRAVRRLLGAAHLSGLQARVRGGQGRPLRRGWRRAVRRLLLLPRRPPGAAPRPAATRATPPIEALPQLRREASLDYQAKRFARAARLPPLERHVSWSQIFAAPQRAAMLVERDPGLDPVDLYRERYAETAGAEPLARLQDLDLGVYLVDDLLVKTDRSSMAHSLELRVPSSTRGRRLRLRLAGAPEAAGVVQEAPAATGGGAPAAEGDPPRPRSGASAPPRRLVPGRLMPFAREVLSPARSRARAASTQPPVRRRSTATAPAARTSAARSGG